MSLFHAGLQPALDSDGNPISGAKWYFYQTGTTTPTNVYSDSGYVTSLGSSITADASGRFATCFVKDTTATRAILKNAGGTTLVDADPVTISSGAGTIVTSVAMSGGTTGLTFSGSPITSSGTFTAAGTLVLANGGTGSTTASGARTNLGAAASGANTDITALSDAVSITTAGTIAANTLGYRGLPQSGKTASYTLVLTDQSNEIYLTGTTAGQTVTIPANASVAFPVGAFAVVTNDSTQNWSIAITTDTLVYSPGGSTGTRTLAPYGTATLRKVTSTRWWITGTGLS